MKERLAALKKKLSKTVLADQAGSRHTEDILARIPPVSVLDKNGDLIP